MKFNHLLAGLVCAGAPIAANAELDKEPLVLGLAIMSQTEAYQDIKSETSPIPVLWGTYKRMWFRGTDIGVSVYEHEYFEISPFISLNMGSGYELSSVEEGSQLYDGLEDAAGAIEAGVEVEVEAGMVELGFSYRTDISDNHKGDIAEISIEEDFLLFNRKLVVMPELSLSWTSEEYNQYYYGVSEANATEFRPMFDAGSGTNFEASVRSMWRVGDVRILGRLAFDKYDSAIIDSPLAKEDQQFSVAVGLGYEF